MSANDDLSRATDPFSEAPVTRRSLLIGTTVVLADLALQSPAAADDANAGYPRAVFGDVSRLITGYPDLSETTAGRMFDALASADPSFPAAVTKLKQMSGEGMFPEDIKKAAGAVGLDALLMTIVTAWYTGTVGGSKGPVVVSYAEALMYRPVADGLSVPTYCNRGPIWWTGLPPEITTMPVNNPKVL